MHPVSVNRVEVNKYDGKTPLIHKYMIKSDLSSRGRGGG